MLSRNPQNASPDLDHQNDEKRIVEEELSRTQGELTRTTARFNDLWNHAPVGYILHSTTGRIIIANRRAESLLRKPEMPGDELAIQDFLNGQSRSSFAQHLHQVVQTGRSCTIEVALKNFDNHWLQLESLATSEHEIRTALFDISRQKRAELDRFKLARQLQQTQKMEVLHELSAGIAHDFNNILQVIMTYGEFVIEDLRAINAKTDTVEAMLAGAQRGADLTRRLLAFSRKSSLQAAVVDLRELTSNATEVVRRTLGELISVRAILPDQEVSVSVDRNLIEQAILNLCVNARDALPNGGHIDIELDEATFDHPRPFTGTTLPPGSYAVLSVSDDGNGMSEEVLEKVFEPFFTTKDVGAGTGLGLSIVYGITRQHHGAIESNSTPGKGSCFRIFLPLSPNSAGASPVKQQHQTNSRVSCSGRILLAEDESAIRQVISRSLANAGYTIVEAANGAEAIRIIHEQETPFDLLLTDAVMPGSSGKNVCEAFREKWPETPVIILSGHGDRVVDNEFLREHAATLLAKPIPSKELLEIVHRILHPALDSVAR